jgi:hypothetical protein
MMREVHAAVVLGVLSLAAGCSSVSVTHDYDTSFDFSTFRSYGWLAAPAPPPANEVVDELILGRIRRAVEAELAAKGYTPAAEAPDFMVAVHCSVKSQVHVSSQPDVGGPYGGYWGATRVYVSTTEEGTIVVDLLDARSHRQVWRGVATGTVERSATPEARDARIAEAVKALLDAFPPKR